MIEPNVIVLVGCTGVGKSSLAYRLAKNIGGEIVNCDSMQVYKGADIATNKPSAEEQIAVRHHLLGYVDPKGGYYGVRNYVKDARAVIEDITKRGKIPIIVGGTFYYIQSLLWDSSSNGSDLESCDDMTPARSVIESPYFSELSEVVKRIDPKLNSSKEVEEYCEKTSLLDILALVDPGANERWHQNDKRKIARSILAYYKSGIPKNAGDKTLKLKYGVVFLCIHIPLKDLDGIINNRVDMMMKRGLFEEVKGLWESLVSDYTSTSECISRNKNRGIWQMIGFKEYIQYCGHKDGKLCESHIQEFVSAVKLATRQYSRRQNNWLKNSLIPLCKTSGSNSTCSFFLLDAKKRTEDQMLILSLVFISNRNNRNFDSLATGSIPEVLSREGTLKENGTCRVYKKYICEYCKDRKGQNRVFVEEIQWNKHLKSNTHSKMQYGRPSKNHQ